ncbi:sulfotransferase family protein [Christiangramia echinicola]|uniref:Sulfotransferase family protein n=1 Tax=Christiangramia echinicola TaxID=279359 RepID=A0A1H1QPE8_9FLAO|nr:sulfotransferase [Christiangramia echinicola]SDS25352.1 Sulfotransferase family protein [Christiangramia echinicola]
MLNNIIYKNKSILHRLTARFRKNSLYSKVLEKTGSKKEKQKWIFILGCYNSGTTLLNEILAQHPEISGLPDEGVMLTNQLVKPEDFGWRRMWSQCEAKMENSSVNKNKNAHIIKKHWSHFYEPNIFFVEKSISNICRIPFFAENFKPAYFIHIVRNGYAAAEGIQRKAEIMEDNKFHGNQKYPIEICIDQWTQSLDKIEKSKIEMENFLEISYEELSEETVKTMNKITDFLNLNNYPPDFFRKSFLIHGSNNKIRNMNKKSLSNLNTRDLEIINERASLYLSKYGYDLITARSDS